MIQVFILDPDLDFLKPIPDTVSKGQKAPDPGSGSATLTGKRLSDLKLQYLSFCVFLDTVW